MYVNSRNVVIALEIESPKKTEEKSFYSQLPASFKVRERSSFVLFLESRFVKVTIYTITRSGARKMWKPFETYRSISKVFHFAYQMQSFPHQTGEVRLHGSVEMGPRLRSRPFLQKVGSEIS